MTNGPLSAEIFERSVKLDRVLRSLLTDYPLKMFLRSSTALRKGIA